MSLLPSGAIESAGYDINNSLRFRASASAYLSRTPGSTGNRQTFTYSFWMKRGTLGTLQRFFGVSDNLTGDFIFQWTTSNTLEIYDNGPAGTSLITTQVFRDPSAWYHIVITYDTTNATTASRVRVYVNGSQVTAFGTAVYPSQNTNSFNNQASIPARIGIWPSGSQYFDGYMAEFNFIDGSAKAASDFGETDPVTGVWKAKKYTGTYGTNGFYLKFSDIATTSGSNAGLGKDFSGNTNYWTTNNISVTSGSTYDAMKDSPTNTSATVANYCTLNPLESFTNPVPQQANLYFNGADYSQLKGTFWVSTGKWYFEWVSISGSLPAYVGVSNASITSNTNVTTSGISWYGHSNSYYKNFTGTSLVSASAISIGDIIGVAFDCDAGTVAYYKNNTLVHTDTTLTPNQLVAPTLIATFSGGGWSPAALNFGQRPFTYTPPSGYKALNTYNLPTPTILQGNKYMDATTWTGNGATNRTISNAGSFKPDLVWTKGRSAAWDNFLQDSIRGAPNFLISNSTAAEGTTLPNIVSSFASNGFVIENNGNSNNNGDTYVGWQWQAGQGSTSSNTQGTITTTTSVNTTAGFSVFTFTGTGASASVGHGLGVAPKFMVFKQRNGSSNWNVLTNAGGSNQYGFLNLTTAFAAAGETWTSTVINIGANFTNGSTYVCYAWAEIAGFSKFGSYVGNGSTDGPFVYLGFRPKYVLVKGASSGGTNYDWYVLDSSRDTYNLTTNFLCPDLSQAEYTGVNKDFLSNGFKIRGTTTGTNTNGVTYIYAAFAENPFKNSLAR